MCILPTCSLFSPNRDRYRSATPDQSGSVLVYIVVVMLIFGFLGAGMISMFTSSSMMSSGVPNYSRDAGHLAEAGMRYAISELRNSGYTENTISTLNSTTYTLNEGSTFTLNVLGKWFTIDPVSHPSGYTSAGAGTITLSAAEGTFPSDEISTDDFDIPTNNISLINLEQYRDALIFSGTPALFTSGVTGVAYASIHIDLADNFEASEDEPLCLAVQSASNQSPMAGGELDLPDEAASFFPEKYGSFYVTDTMDEKRLYFYETMETQPSVKLTGLSEAVAVNTNEYVILSPRNHMIVATGTSGSTSTGGANYHTANYRQNIDSPQDVKSPMDLPADISPTTIADFSAPAESAGGAIEVSVDAEGKPLITLGGGTTNAFGSVWYGGTSARGGTNVCTNGVCEFNDGFRAFFIVDYQGAGDGFTFAVVNAASNTTASTGGSGTSGELMGYAGDGLDGNGLQAPKLALEFDPYINNNAYDPATGSGRDDPGSGDMDYLQFVFWGDTADDLFDDNVHDFGGFREKWTFTNPTGPVLSFPEISPSDGAVYVGSLDHYLYAINPDGTLKWRRDLHDQIWSSATIGNSGRVYIGADTGGGTLYNYSQSGSAAGGFWPYNTPSSNIRTKPAIGADGTLYFGTWDNDRYFYALNPDASLKWRYDLGYNVAVDSSPTIGPDGTIYFGSDSNLLYAITDSGTFATTEWTFTTGGDIVVKPAVDMDTGNIYFGSFDNKVYALESDGTELWNYDTGEDVQSSPDIGADGTVYIGSDSGNLYALDPAETPSAGRVKWQFSIGRPVNSVTVGSDETIWVGADDNVLYAFDPDGNKLTEFDLGRDVRSRPTEADNGMLYVGSGSSANWGGSVSAITPPCSPANDQSLYVTSTELAGEIDHVTDNWINDNRYWAIRVEIDRDTTPNSIGKYDYTLKAWIRQCSDSTCVSSASGQSILNTYFADTRIEYAATSPHLQQAIELCSDDHADFDTALIGFTEATGSATQNVIIKNLEIGLVRPGDDVITTDPNW